MFHCLHAGKGSGPFQFNYPFYGLFKMATGNNPMMILNNYATQHGVRFREECEEIGPDHNKTFVCTLYIQEYSAQGQANSKKEAKKIAAANLLKKLPQSPLRLRSTSRELSPLSPTASPAASPLQQNPKSALNEFCQKNNLSSPNYTQTDQSGPAHQRQFTVECIVYNTDSLLVAKDSGTGKSLKLAECDAAAKALNHLYISKNPLTDQSFINMEGTGASDISEPISVSIKNQLQELCQKNSLQIPEYTLVNRVTGSNNHTEFSVLCQIKDRYGDIIDRIFGNGSTKRGAETDAAANMLPKIRTVIENSNNGIILSSGRPTFSLNEDTTSLIDIDEIIARLVGRDLNMPEYLFEVTEPADPSDRSTIQHLCLAYSYHSNPSSVAMQCNYDITKLPFVGHGIAYTKDEAKYEALLKLYENVNEMLEVQ